MIASQMQGCTTVCFRHLIKKEKEKTESTWQELSDE